MKKPKHSKEVNTIYKTSNYGIFKPSPDNRQIRKNWVNRLAKSMEERGYYPDAPMVVNSNMTIREGHHRFLAAQKVGVPVYFFIEDDNSRGNDFEKMMRLNELMHTWQKGDSLPGLVDRDYDSYVRLQDFIEKFPDFSLTEQIMFMGNSASDANKLKFTRGLWEHGNVKTANKWASDIMKLEPYFRNGYNKSLFVRAMIDIFAKRPEFIFDEFLHKVNLRPGMIHLCGSKDQYKEMIENLYNYRRNNNDKINLRF